MTLAQRIRKEAKRQGLGIEEFRVQTGIPSTTFYALLNGEQPKKVATVERVRRGLRSAGVLGAVLA